MNQRTLRYRVLALILGALFVGLAPLVHAFCVSPATTLASSTTATSMTHVMADGSTMVMALPGETPLAIGTTETVSTVASVEKTVAAASEPSATTLIGSILVAVGIAILTFFGIRKCAQWRAERIAPARDTPLGRRRWPEQSFFRPYAVSLDSLGISRT